MRKRGELAGPLRNVVFSLAREGSHGGAYWRLVLECGHTVTRRRHVVKSWADVAQTMFQPIARKLAPQRAECYSCEAGAAHVDPLIMFKVFGGEVPA